MSTPTTHALDLTGIDGNNLVLNEPHILPTGLDLRAFMTDYGPFYKEGLVVKDSSSGATLTSDKYDLSDLETDITIKTGKEVFKTVIIKDSSVSDNILITYQVVGGDYERLSANTIDLLNQAMNSDRPVDWVDVLNKPQLYPASSHLHLLQDVKGFGPFVTALDRIVNAISVSNLPLYQHIVDWVKNRTGTRELVVLRPSQTSYNRGQTVVFTIDAVNLDSPWFYYWSIEDFGTVSGDFVIETGELNLKTGFATLNIETTASGGSTGIQEFRVLIRKDGITGEVICKSGVVTLNA